jgi:uncharacterized membrane protein
MANRDLAGPAVTAKLGSHPIHPMLIPFPIAFLVAAFACDLVYLYAPTEFWARAAFWLLGAGIAMAALAAVAGLTDFLGNARIRALSDAWQHMIGNVVAVLLTLISFGLRYRYGAADAIMPWGVLLSGAVVVLLLFTGWKGGDLVYHDRVGVQPDEPTYRAPTEARMVKRRP